MTDSRVYTPAQPWYPPVTPVEFPEGRLTPAWVGKVAKSKHGDIVIRSHLVPRHPQDKRYMGAFRTFWRALAFADRKGVYAMLERWLADADAELASTGLTDEETGILRRFRGDVDGALNRLRRADDEPMAWAGAEFSKYAPEERVMLEALIGAITLHRAGDLSDDELYSILGSLDVDPADRDTGITSAALTKIRTAAQTGEALELESTYRRS
ncbi:hypothetical protein [Mycolicibacterium obuense]|uniref:Uncharacterized protein n=1 Tax=Mycolicibacterium obuense TaxID=1807 RepID=A0A0M2K0Q3_9MYCO|nr:hypothetical protein [Mycolicibacterium obuense]KKF02917.1 hypothetical protein WN67_06005 [Mycolicibacterium obuense]